MIFIALFRAEYLRFALRDYPRLIVPYPARETTLTRSEALANFDYVMAEKDFRIELMEKWLARHFRIDVTLSRNGLEHFSNWFDRYGVFAVTPYSDFDVAWDTYCPAWDGRHRSLNLVFDTALFYGDLLIKSYPFLRWTFYDLLPEGSSIRNESFYRPTLTGFSGEWKTDPLQLCFRKYYYAAIERLQKSPLPLRKGGLTQLFSLGCYGADNYSAEPNPRGGKMQRHYHADGPRQDVSVAFGAKAAK